MGFYLAPKWFMKELKLLDKGYFAIFNPEIKRWQIRLWQPEYRERFDISLSELLKRSYLVKSVRRERNGLDIGFMPLDRRTLTVLRHERWNYENQKEFLRQLDEHNKRVLQKTDEYVEDACRQAVKTGYNAWKNSFLDLGKK